MQLALVGFTLLNLVILGCVLLFVRASRVRALPDERQDLEENALTRTDWELARNERCLPTSCPRLIGQPPRPRKDVTCEVCAATYLEARLQRLLNMAVASEAPGQESPLLLDPALGRAGPLRLGSLEELRPEGAPPVEHRNRQTSHGRGRSTTSGRRALIRLGLGVVCVAAGAGIAAFGGMPALILPGYLTVLVGLVLMASGAVSGAA
jgi:hypothetical protein